MKHLDIFCTTKNLVKNVGRLHWDRAPSLKFSRIKINVLKKQMNGKARMGSENQLSAAASSSFFDGNNHAPKLIASWF